MTTKGANLQDKVIFTTGWFGDGLSILECKQPNGEASYRIENLGVFQGSEWMFDLDDDDWQRLLDDEDEEIDWTEQKRDYEQKQGEQPQPEIPTFSSFEDALSYAGEKWAHLLTSSPHFIHSEYVQPLREHLENVISGITPDERVAFGDTFPKTVEEWFDRLPSGSER